jgi:hypothetical protein
MPAVRKPKAWPPRGSANRPADVPQLKALLAPYPADDMGREFIIGRFQLLGACPSNVCKDAILKFYCPI